MRPATNTELVRACLSGEEAAWRTLILRYQGLIYSIPLRYSMSREDADDVFQSVCLALLKHLGSLRDPERLGAWLVTTTQRECWARWRVEAREGQTIDDNRNNGDDEIDPEAMVSLFEETQTVLKALEQMPERCQRLLRRLYLDTEPATYAKLAEELEMPVNSLGPTRARCLERLVELLHDWPVHGVLSKPRRALV